jgi:hypothetical protein
MDNITHKTIVSDLTKIKVPKCYEKYVYKAIDSKMQLLTLKEFIEVTEFNIHAETFDILFMNINDEGIPIYIDEAMLNWMGYAGETMSKKIQTCKILLNGNFEEESDYKIMRNKTYAQYLDEFKDTNASIFNNSNLPQPVTGPAARSKTHLIVMPDAFRSLCMMINTDKGKQIRKYYITLEKLIKAYNLYQTIYRGREAEQAMNCKDDNITQMMQKILELGNDNKKIMMDMKYQNKELIYQNKDLHNTVSEVKEKVDILDTRLDKVLPNSVSIEKIKTKNQPFVVIIRDTDVNDGEFDLYVMRCQEKRIQSALRRLKKKYGDTLVISKHIKQPNAIVFWETIKEKNKCNIEWSAGTNWFRLIDITRSKLYSDIDEMDKNRQLKFV